MTALAASPVVYEKIINKENIPDDAYLVGGDDGRIYVSYITPPSFLEKVVHYVKEFFRALCVTLKTFFCMGDGTNLKNLWKNVFSSYSMKRVELAGPDIIDPRLQTTLNEVSRFNGYKFENKPEGHEVVLTGTSMRPNGLALDEIFGADVSGKPQIGNPISKTPDLSLSESKIAYYKEDPRRLIDEILAMEDDAVTSVSFNGKSGSYVYFDSSSNKYEEVPLSDLSSLYGTGTVNISGKVLKALIDPARHKRYVPECIPLPFYNAVVDAVKNDNLIELPCCDRDPVLLFNMAYPNDEFGKSAREKAPYFSETLRDAVREPVKYGFESSKDVLNLISKLTVYQFAALFSHSQPYLRLVGDRNKLLDGSVTVEFDVVDLWSSCFIRGYKSPVNVRTKGNENHEIDLRVAEVSDGNLMYAMRESDQSIALLTARGMGVWKNPPKRIWESRFNAIMKGGCPNNGTVLIVPGHQPCHEDGAIQIGQECEEIFRKCLLDEAIPKEQRDSLRKATIIFPHDKGPDIYELSRILKNVFGNALAVRPENASDPICTISSRVVSTIHDELKGVYVDASNGAYSLDCPHPATTEENAYVGGLNLGALVYEPTVVRVPGSSLREVLGY